MPTLYLLGTGAAISDPHRTTTMLAVSDGTSTLVIDCGGDVVQRLLAAGIDLSTISALIITHEHPDHVSGYPLFIEKIWIAGRQEPIPLYGIRPAIDQARRCFETFDTDDWDLPEQQWHEVAYEENALVLDDDPWRVTASPGIHGKPVVGLRLEYKPTGSVVTYSCDTAPSPAITRLARGADILVHEANGEGEGHTSIPQAAAVAQEAETHRLLLVHLSPGDKEAELRSAQQTFAATELGDELGTYDF